MGIISGGSVAFVALAAACIVHQSQRLAPVPTTSSIRPSLGAQSAALLPPMVRAEFDGASLVLTGRLGETALRDAIIERARRLYGPERVTDRLVLSPDSIAPWLRAPFPPDLRVTRRATALLADGRLLVIADTGTDAAQTRLESALHASNTSGLRIDLRINTGDVELVEPGTASKPHATAATR